MQFYHVFDIQTQRPLESTQNSLVSVTIQHESCCLADGLTKALLCAKDKEEARALFEERVHPLFPTTKVWLFSHEDVAS
jgi:thiamine biosynthesis lipoprotein ApbE